MSKFNILFTSILLATIVFACDTDEIKLLDEKEQVATKTCLIKSANHGYGIVYNFEYDNKKNLTKILGFADFNTISYENSLPKKAESSLDKSYYINFQYDSKGALSLINFVGKDGLGKPFDFKSKVYTNAKKQAEKIDLLFPIFDTILETKMEYDTKGNLKKISVVEDGKSKPILENLSFDDKKSPYLNAPFSNIMLYFIIISSTVGGENTTYFANKNNPTSTRIYSESGDILYTYQYEYNTNGYPTKTKVIRKANGKEEAYEESFTYNCQ